MRNKWQARQLGEYVRTARLERGWSLRTLAAQANVDFGWLGRLERGEFAAPDPGSLGELCLALDISIADVFMEAGYPVSLALPAPRTYFRSKYGLTDQEIAQVERYITIINAQVRRQQQEGDDERNDYTDHSTAA